MSRFLIAPLFAATCVLAAACDDSSRKLLSVPEFSQPDSGQEAEQYRNWQPMERVAFLAGRVSVADQLYREGQDADALRHLKKPVEEMYRLGRLELQRTGLRSILFESLAQEMETERPRGEIESLLELAKSDLIDVLVQDAGEAGARIGFLLNLSAQAYERGVDMGSIRSAEDYQASYGYAVAARDLINALDLEGSEKLKLELELLVLMWPAAGPVSEAAPPPDMQMAEQFSQIKLALATLP